MVVHRGRDRGGTDTEDVTEWYRHRGRDNGGTDIEDVTVVLQTQRT